MTNLTYAANTLSKAPILIDDTPALTVREVRARARRFVSNKEVMGDAKCGLIVVDYLQLMRGSAQAARASREQEISEISRGLKALAKENGAPVETNIVTTVGRPHHKILDVAESEKIDLIVIASHQPGLADYLLGSVAAGVVRHAKCSVHVMR